MALRNLLIALLSALATTAVAQIPAPFPPDFIVDQYYPEASRRLGHMARVVFRVRQSGLATELTPRYTLLESFDFMLGRPERVFDTPGSIARLVESAEKLVRRLPLPESPRSDIDMRVSVLFLLQDCDQMKHDAKADYYITVCRDAVPSYPMD